MSLGFSLLLQVCAEAAAAFVVKVCTKVIIEPPPIFHFRRKKDCPFLCSCRNETAFYCIDIFFPYYFLRSSGKKGVKPISIVFTTNCLIRKSFLFCCYSRKMLTIVIYSILYSKAFYLHMAWLFYILLHYAVETLFFLAVQKTLN